MQPNSTTIIVEAEVKGFKFQMEVIAKDLLSAEYIMRTELGRMVGPGREFRTSMTCLATPKEWVSSSGQNPQVVTWTYTFEGTATEVK
jgi:hypothetical protein